MCTHHRHTQTHTVRHHHVAHHLHTSTTTTTSTTTSTTTYPPPSPPSPPLTTTTFITTKVVRRAWEGGVAGGQTLRNALAALEKDEERFEALSKVRGGEGEVNERRMRGE